MVYWVRDATLKSADDDGKNLVRDGVRVARVQVVILIQKWMPSEPTVASYIILMLYLYKYVVDSAQHISDVCINIA